MRDEDSEELATHKRAARGSARGGKKGAAAEKGGGGAAAKKGGAGSGTSKAKAGGGAKKAAAAGGKKGGGQVAAKPTRHSTRKTAGRRKEPTEPATPKARASKRSRR